MKTFLLICAAIVFCDSTISSVAKADEFRVVAYVPNWIELREFSKTIEYEQLTHINIAFENPTDDQGTISFAQDNQYLIDQARKHGVKVLVSIGGGSASSDKKLLARYAHLLSADQRSQFAVSLANYVDQHKFDGLDVDIEGSSITKDYGPFIEQLAVEIKKADKLLTAALSKGYGGSKVPSNVLPLFDFINIMAYDGAGSWDPDSPGQHSSMEFAKQNVEYWLDRGLKKSNAVMGIPFYGYGFGEDFRKSPYAYSTILRKYPGADEQDKIGNTIWHNSVPTIKEKTQFAIRQGVGGLMIWSLDNDVAGDQSLLKAIVDARRSR